MTLCEFCVLQQADGRCSRGHDAKENEMCGFHPRDRAVLLNTGGLYRAGTT